MNSAIERLLTLRVADVMQRHLVEVHETYDIASASQLPLLRDSADEVLCLLAPARALSVAISYVNYPGT